MSGLKVVRERMEEAIAARKCHVCGCFHKTVEELEASPTGQRELAGELQRARSLFAPHKYDCLGCATCYPAIAANAFTEAFPAEGASMGLCPAEEPEARAGWPPLPGDYHLARYSAPVAVCTLYSEELAGAIARRAPEGVSIVGTLHTENLGIERVIRNVIANPHVRRLVLCGEDARQAIGHLPGQSLASLFAHGIDDHGRIRGARGKRPVLKNLSPADVDAFLRQVEPRLLIGELDADVVAHAVCDAAGDAPGPFTASPRRTATPIVEAVEPTRLTLDPAGYCVVYPDRARRRLRVEHYENKGVLTTILEGDTPAALYAALIERGLVSRLDHAAYLGRELARAEHALASGEPYVQDRAAGEVADTRQTGGCGCGSGCA